MPSQQRDPADWEVGDIVTRDGSDEQEILELFGGDPPDTLTVRCVKEPPPGEGATEPWCRLGDEETNLVRRYHFVRAKADDRSPRAYLEEEIPEMGYEEIAEHLNDFIVFKGLSAEFREFVINEFP